MDGVFTLHSHLASSTAVHILEQGQRPTCDYDYAGEILTRR